MYDTRPNLVIAFHGCEKSVRDQLLINPEIIRVSNQPFDWLGNGFYFWENNLERAIAWAEQKAKRSHAFKEPSVIGAVINLGYCLDLLDTHFIEMLRNAYFQFSELFMQLGKELPVNKNLSSDPHDDLLVRNLDCAVIEFLHDKFDEEFLKAPQKGFQVKRAAKFDSSRGVFKEGGPALS